MFVALVLVGQVGECTANVALERRASPYLVPALAGVVNAIVGACLVGGTPTLIRRMWSPMLGGAATVVAGAAAWAQYPHIWPAVWSSMAVADRLAR